ncbi:hypothetical protein AMIS_67150 [Actinoplanes missouriensis 431]|uniref:Uncharacterized protein n=1 Tax=Actinoplanes missouriensis (strain ATCC 14538 / DSM 43046 / CBS 188.64 / JCM 3121 / NBRC 102363 / NCIMB 12654 / NRRL B-3342 / UNCC 431) TaxID=512565 RepID=I0HFZ8_ACTM4|nr:hypothetical protein [Actinoplanes missouriensis]BAL91935.1 hypothetical protein AMIS_67150 [Actinoplanes missouriensis 431]
MTGLESLYTAQKVYRPLALRLEIANECTCVHWDRYSVNDGSGIESQVARHCAHYPDDPDVAAYRALPAEAFESVAAGAEYGIQWLSLADLHHTLTDRRPVIAFVVIGKTVFFRVELSAVERQIQRPDGENENAYTSLVLAVTNQLRNLQVSRWADDITRAARENVNWSIIMRRHHERGIRMSLGGTAFTLAEKADRTALKLLGAVGSEDDPERRRKLLGSRLMAMQVGGAALAEDQMPYGWELEKDKRGRERRVKTKGLIPVAVAANAPALAAAYAMHAEGKTYESICTALAEFEKDGVMSRRSGQRYDLDFAAAVGDTFRAYDAALTVFQAHWPSGIPRPTPPDEATIVAYESGEDPAELFTYEQRLVIARPELLRTGMLLRAVVNDIRGRGLELAGLTPHYADDYDEKGVFYLEARWPWPIDAGTGQEMPRFGIPDEILRLSAGRLLRSIGRRRKPTGGLAHVRTERRVLQGFGTWELADGREATLIARMNNNGRANMVLLGRNKPADGTSPGWTRELAQPKKCILATLNLNALCGDLAHRIGEAVTAQIDPARLAPASAVLRAESTDRTEHVRAGLLARAEAADQAAEKSERAARGARTSAALAAEDGDEEEAAEYRKDASSHAVDARRARQEAETLRQRAADLDQQTERAQTANVNLSTTAYLVAGLQRAASNNGTGPAALGELADAHLHSWNVQASRDTEGYWANYEVKLDVPVLPGGVVQIDIRGRVRDVRTRRPMTGLRGAVAQGATAETVFAKGLPLNAVVTADLNRKTLLNRHIMPWLSSHQVSTRGARCALVDHPLPEVRQVVYADVTGTDMPQLAAYPTAWREHILATYRDPGLQWGNAASPDDTTLVRQLIATLGLPGVRSDGRGLEIKSIARYAGVAADVVRELVLPTSRYGLGFERPRYLAYVGERSDRVQLISCTHGCEQGLCDLVALYPEVSASGYGVICSTCWRLPNTADPKWQTIVFPAIYGRSFNRTSPKGSLRDAVQTVPIGPAVPMAIVD